ncbi:MAG TPA: hypothetical protein VFE35_12505 [Candidatus Cybelea sp.]|nr:hypothetical protein [Candidatus Cybelea sp.]
MTQATRRLQFVLFAILAACAGVSVPGNGPHLLPSTKLAQSRLALPSELLYVAGGPTEEPHPFIEVFNAQDTSSSPQPIYTIPPIGGGSYFLLAVDATNDLFAINLTNRAKLLVFPSGKSVPSISCVLANTPQGIYIARNVLYLATALYTIEEYALPIHAGHKCPNPNATLTDQRAKLRGTLGLWAPVVDPHGDIFDIWFDGLGETIDEFPAGSKRARRFAPLPNTGGAYYLLSDSSGNLVTSIAGTGSQYDSIAMFPHGMHSPKRFHPISNGSYLGFAIAEHGTELFAARDYPTTEVQVYAYDSTTGNVGRLLRSFTDVWYYAQPIAVFSRK